MQSVSGLLKFVLFRYQSYGLPTLKYYLLNKLTVYKVANVLRHYETFHLEGFSKSTGQARKDEAECLKINFGKQFTFFAKKYSFES